MKNRAVWYLTICVLISALITAAAFILPFVHDIGFWSAYISSLAAVILVGVLDYLALRSSETSNSFYGLPVAIIGGIYLVIQLILVMMAVVFSVFPGIYMLLLFLSAMVVYMILIMTAFHGKASAEAADRYVSERADKLA